MILYELSCSTPNKNHTKWFHMLHGFIGRLCSRQEEKLHPRCCSVLYALNNLNSDLQIGLKVSNCDITCWRSGGRIVCKIASWDIEQSSRLTGAEVEAEFERLLAEAKGCKIVTFCDSLWELYQSYVRFYILIYGGISWYLMFSSHCTVKARSWTELGAECGATKKQRSHANTATELLLSYWAVLHL